MEFLVTMTTHVPEGTSEAAVDDIRAREAEHSRELAAQGHLLRLWRPPLAPGEWRSLGLFEAADGTALDSILLSMPLHIWRTDEVVPLSPHPNDPGRQAHREGAPRAVGNEFLTTWTISVPQGATNDAVNAADDREAERAQELADQGRLLRLWGLPDEHRALGLWRLCNEEEIGPILASLPLNPWAVVETVHLTPHPNDPGQEHP
jgi:muconolactone delta-isomerase